MGTVGGVPSNGSDAARGVVRKGIRWTSSRSAQAGRRSERQTSALLQADIVVATLSGCAHSSLAEAQQAIAPEPLFDAVVVDEAAQAVEPSTYIPLRYARARRVGRGSRAASCYFVIPGDGARGLRAVAV